MCVTPLGSHGTNNTLVCKSGAQFCKSVPSDSQSVCTDLVRFTQQEFPMKHCDANWSNTGLVHEYKITFFFSPNLLV